MSKMASTTTGGYGMRGISISTHLSDGTGRDWYILGDSGLRNGRRTPPPKPFGRTSISGASSMTELRKQLYRTPSSAQGRMRSPQRSTPGKPSSAIVDRWRKHQALIPGTRNGLPLNQTPEVDVDSSIKLKTSPIDAYTHFSDERTGRRLAYSRYVTELAAKKYAAADGEGAWNGLPPLRGNLTSLSAPML
eukprot:TRINITY_DN110694_c0_g1_i1.p1 TRINITY_DN110694_c0_g1~~TRINITY_DN110694_c0_g1_i1.p1  ORF type:complete len:216 (-),score=16.67 TRINITY_DN110694_c0_g1_i1:103-675(-)